MTIEEFFKEHKKVALGFSGGVDSSYLFYAGLKYGADVKAFFVKTQFQPDFELRDAYRLAKSIGAEFEVIEADALENPIVASNPKDRCYHCKNNVFTKILVKAAYEGYATIIDGTNASDDSADRPGMRALGEMKVLSPLRMCGLTKDDVRRLSKEAGLFTWNKPSYACLATRIPTGEEINEEKLKKIENAEDILFEMGFSDFRIRLHNGAALIQLKPEQMKNLIEKREAVKNTLKKHFDMIMLDLEER